MINQLVLLVRIQINFISPSSLSKKQRLDFEIILGLVEYENPNPLQMIIQRTIGTGKSDLIHSISHSLSASTYVGKIPLLFLSMIGLVAFNIHAKTIHSSLKFLSKIS